MDGPFGLPEVAAIVLAVRIVLSVAWIRYAPRDPPGGSPARSSR